MADKSYAPTIDSRPKGEVKSAVESYENYHTSFGGDVEARKKEYADMVNKYYDLATSFYEYGWGSSFHFAHRWKNETHEESLKRHEHYLALKLKLDKDDKVLDVGCGIGGPLREIALFAGCQITGLNNNAYQISRGEHYNKLVGHGIDKRCNFVKGDFMKMPFQEGAFDAIYEIDATCHAPDAVGCYKEIYRVLKPGGLFAGYEWLSTAAYNPENKEHRTIMAEIELGNGLPDVRSIEQCKAALVAAGFEIVEEEDLAPTADIPWWEPLDPQRVSVKTFRTTGLGRLCTKVLVNVLETLRVAPSGSSRVASFLERAGDSLTAGGKAGIFTPMYFFVVRKPAKATSVRPANSTATSGRVTGSQAY